MKYLINMGTVYTHRYYKILESGTLIEKRIKTGSDLFKTLDVQNTIIILMLCVI